MELWPYGFFGLGLGLGIWTFGLSWIWTSGSVTKDFPIMTCGLLDFVQEPRDRLFGLESKFRNFKSKFRKLF